MVTFLSTALILGYGLFQFLVMAGPVLVLLAGILVIARIITGSQHR